MIHTQGGSVLYVYSTFQADNSYHSKLMRGSQNFEFGSRDSGHANLCVVLYSVRWRGPLFIIVPNLKRIAQLVQKILRGSQNLEIRSCDMGHAPLRVILWSSRREVPFSMTIPNFKRIALFLEKLLGGPKISKLGHVTQATPTYGSFYGPHIIGVRPICLCQFSSR